MMMLAAFLVAAASSPCDNSQTQSDLDVCWAAQAQKADDELNATYQRVRKGLQGLGVDPAVLIPPETAWISARDKTCAFEEALYKGGSIAPMIYSECVYRMTRARTARIAGLYDTLKAEGVVTTAKPASAQVDGELNRVYKLYLKQDLGQAEKQALIDSEVAWLSYRDKACKVEGGNCFDALESERTAELEAGWVGEQFW